MSLLPPLVLTIAGSDSGGGAGIQADSRVIHALGGYALTAITAITAQNTRGLLAWQAVSTRLLTAQLAALPGDAPPQAIKTGLLPGARAVQAVAAALAAYPDTPLVIDPVLGASSGPRFLPPAGLRALQRALLPRATLLTPNWPEAAALTGQPVDTFADAQAAAHALLATGCQAVLVKGGHAPGDACRDYLVTAAGETHWLESPRVPTPNTHGTGCTLSAAIATELAWGRPLVAAVTRAHQWLYQSLRAHAHLSFGPGAGPAFPGLLRARPEEASPPGSPTPQGGARQ